MSDFDPLPTSDCPECARLGSLWEAAVPRIAALEAQVRDLRDQLHCNSSNSSRPPSADPPAAPKPVVKPRSGRRPGGQPGHRGHFRHRLPAQRVDQVVAHVPSICSGSQAPLPQDPSPSDPEPTWHQVAEAPQLAAVVVEHQGPARICPGCGKLNRASIPAPIADHVIGPRLAALTSYLSGRHHLGKRGVQEFVQTVFGVPISLGTVAALERQTAAALADAHDEAKHAVRQAPVKNTDETGWKQAGQTRWLWTATTTTAAFFVIHARRGWSGLQALLGEAVTGVVCSDRWSASNRLPLEQRQICWAHRKRDFQKCVDRGGGAETIGRAGLRAVEALFAAWWDFRQRRSDRGLLQARIEPIARELQGVLEHGRGCADAKAATVCANLLGLLPALWRFATIEGVEPTNNHAERVLRAGVLWRKNAFGNHSEAGCRFAERLLTVVQTLRLQQRPVLDYLHQAVVAHRLGQPTPRLLT